MNKNLCKKLLLIPLIIFFILMVFVLCPGKRLNAEDNLQEMKSSTGSTLKYRYSNEKVYGLAEYDYPLNEYRAAWVSHFAGDVHAYKNEESYKAEITTILDNMERWGMNALVFHVRTHNNALYKSELNPLATFYATVNFEEFDPLEWIIEECHKRGMEFHAWMNPYRISTTGSSTQYVSGDIPDCNPGKDPSKLLQSGNSIILNPALQEVRDFIVDTCMEVIENYDIDAIHFDDYFYISGVETDKTGDWKRQQVDLFIEQLHNAMKKYNTENNKCVQLGISPSGIYQNGGYAVEPSYDENGNLISPLYSNTSGFAHYDNYLYSDTKKWIDEGWIDYITPQAYWGMEHTGNNFFELTRWWSWAVAKKKTNLYMGVGIYMALESGTSGKKWQLNQNEVQNQLLNAGMYDEINGICFYKYSSMTSKNSSIISKGVELISTDYWKKRIPSAVIKTYADEFEEVIPTNLELEGSTLTWDAIDNTRGYMVYKIDKNSTLNQNNINHLYKYVQTNSITIDDPIRYDYYVASVNLANEISSAAQYGSEVSQVDYLIAMIDSLPIVDKITLADEPKISSLLKTYNKLTDEEKTQITNYSKLEELEIQIAKIKAVAAQAKEYINKLNKHISGDYELPTDQYVSWSYANIDDAKYYNIATGKKLLYPLNKTYIELLLTYERGGIIYTEEVEFNIGYISDSQTGLFYRGDASSMSKVDVGPYNSTEENKYIGWSGYTLTKGEKVLFIAELNMHIITEANNIPSCNWTSVAGVYKNDTSSSLKMTIGNAFQSNSTYGHFIIGADNKVKTIYSSSSTTDSVTLEKGEILVISRYLDATLSENFICPSQGEIAEGDTVILQKVEFAQVTEDEKVQMVIAEINSLPTTIEVSDETAIMAAKNNYDALTEEQKAQVTNYSKLEQAIKDLEAAKKENAEFEENKKQVYIDAQEYIGDIQYTIVGQNKIKALLNKLQSGLSLATTNLELAKLYNEFIEAADEVPTYNEELNEYKMTASSRISSYVNLDEYSSTHRRQIERLINDCLGFINNAADFANVDSAVETYTELMDQVPTMAEILAESKENAKITLDNYQMKEGLSDSQKQHILAMKEEIKVTIDSALTTEEVTTIVNGFYNRVDDYVAEMSTAIANAIEYFESKENVSSEAIFIVSNYINLVKKTGSMEEISELIHAFDIEIEESIDPIEDKPKNCKNSSIAMFEILAMIALVYIVIKKK